MMARALSNREHSSPFFSAAASGTAGRASTDATAQQPRRQPREIPGGREGRDHRVPEGRRPRPVPEPPAASPGAPGANERQHARPRPPKQLAQTNGLVVCSTAEFHQPGVPGGTQHASVARGRPPRLCSCGRHWPHHCAKQTLAKNDGNDEQLPNVKVGNTSSSLLDWWSALSHKRYWFLGEKERRVGWG